MTVRRAISPAPVASRAAAGHILDLARAMIRQARILKAAGSLTDARALAGRARELDRLGWARLRAA